MARRTDNALMNTQRVINRDVNAAMRAERAVRLRAKRLTFATIAAECGYASAGAARNAIMRELQRRTSGAVDEWRREALNELDELQAAIWERATDPESGEKGVSLFAQDRVLAIIQERNRLLNLYPKDDAAQQTNVRRIYERR